MTIFLYWFRIKLSAGGANNQREGMMRTCVISLLAIILMVLPAESYYDLEITEQKILPDKVLGCKDEDAGGELAMYLRQKSYEELRIKFSGYLKAKRCKFYRFPASYHRSIYSKAKQLYRKFAMMMVIQMKSSEVYLPLPIIEPETWLTE